MLQAEIRRGKPEDWQAIQALLHSAALPSSDLAAAKLEGFFVATLQSQMVGVAGVEVAAPFGLLRSVVVQKDQRRSGLGKQLVEHCMGFARGRSLRALYLIPNDQIAGDFFKRLGFTPIERHLVPSPLRGLAEFTHLCPQSYPCLRKTLDPNFTEEAIMKKLEVFDPAMCCATGVCGVDVDPVLAQFAADLKWVEEQGVVVTRHNLGQEPQAFASNPVVVKELEAGMDRLPILIVDGNIVSTGLYPSRQQLAQKLGITLPACEKPRIKISACCSQDSGCC